jgi:hypothetical protein
MKQVQPLWLHAALADATLIVVALDRRGLPDLSVHWVTRSND